MVARFQMRLRYSIICRMIAGQKKDIEKSSYDCNSRTDIFSLITFIYLVTSSGPEEEVGRIGTSLTSERTSDPEDVRTTAERATLSDP